MYFFQWEAGLPCPSFSDFSLPLFCCLPALPLVVGSGRRVYAGDWGVGESGFVV